MTMKPRVKIDPLSPVGIPAAALTVSQRRDFNGDFGENLLREHVHDTPHRD